MYFFIEAFLLGLIFNAAPGVVFAETVKRGINGGVWPALQVQLGSLSGDALWAIIGLLGIGVLFNLKVLIIPLSVIGSLYLFYLAFDSYIQSNKKLESYSINSIKHSPLLAGVILSITNPQNLIYWAALGSAFSALGINDPELPDYLIFFSGFMSSSIIWCFVCASSVNYFYKDANQVWKSLSYKFCSIIFAYLGIGTLYNLIT